MASLHNVTQVTKSIAKYSLILICAIILFYFGINIGKAMKSVFFPLPPVKPTVSFGKLPAIKFPQSITNRKLSYVIDTLSGSLPIFQRTIFIKKITVNEPSLLDLRRAKDSVILAGFTSIETLLEEHIYQWIDYNTLPKTLTMNVVTLNFQLTSPFLTFPPIIDRSVPNVGDAQSKADEFLNSMKGLRPDMDKKITTIYTYDIDNGRIIEATGPGRVRFVEFNYFQSPVNNLPIVYPIPKKSTMRVTVAPYGLSESNTLGVVDAQYLHQNIGDIQATYPLKSVQQAYTDLQKGKAYIAAYFGNKNPVKVKDASLAYYISDKEQPYLMPIYIFKGLNDEFYAYVSAVDDAWIE